MDKSYDRNPKNHSASLLHYSRKIDQALFNISWAVNTSDIDELYKFIHKPVPAAELTRKIRQVLDDCKVAKNLWTDQNKQPA